MLKQKDKSTGTVLIGYPLAILHDPHTLAHLADQKQVRPCVHRWRVAERTGRLCAADARGAQWPQHLEQKEDEPD